METTTLVLSIVGCVTGLFSLLVTHHNQIENRHANLINLKLEYINTLLRVRSIISSSRLNIETANLSLRNLKNNAQGNEIKGLLDELLRQYEEINRRNEEAYTAIDNLDMSKENRKKTVISLQEHRPTLSSLEKQTLDYEKETLDIVNRINKLILNQNIEIFEKLFPKAKGDPKTK